MDSTTPPTPEQDDDPTQKAFEDRIYSALLKAHTSHIGEDCFCTTELAGIYSFILEQFNAYAERKVVEARKKGYLKGYNSGWVSASRNLNTKKYVYFAEQLESAARKLRHVEATLSPKPEEEV